MQKVSLKALPQPGNIDWLMVKMPNGHFRSKCVLLLLRSFFVDSVSLRCPNEESAGCQLGTLEELFLKQKNKMATINNGKFYLYTYLQFTYIVLRDTILVSRPRFSGSRNLFMM